MTLSMDLLMPRSPRLCLFILGAVALSSLACAGRKIDETKSVCDKPVTTWRALTDKSKEYITTSCKREGNKCQQASNVLCRGAWVYSAQFHTLDAWRVNHSKAPVEDRIEAYFTYFLKPTVRMHEEFWSQAITSNNVREAFGQTRTVMTNESKTLTDDYIMAIRDDIRATQNPKKKALLIDAYASMKSLNAQAFDPTSFDKIDAFKVQAREEIARYDALKIKLEFVDSAAPEPDPEPTPPEPSAAPPAAPMVAPVPSTPQAPPAVAPSKAQPVETPEEDRSESKNQEDESKKKLKDVTQQKKTPADQWSLD